MTIGSFLKKRKASFIKGLEQAEAVAVKTLEILNFDCGLLTVLQEDQEPRDKRSVRKKPKNKRLKAIEQRVKNDQKPTQRSPEWGKDVFSSTALSPHDEILIWIDDVATKAKTESLDPEEKNVIAQFINELLSTSDDKAFVVHLQDELEKSGLHDYLASVDLKGKNGGIVQEDRGFEIYENIKKERKKMEEEDVDVKERTELKNSALETSAEHCLLIFLQRVLSDEENIGPAYNKVIEVLQKSGLDSELIKKLREKPQENDNSTVEILKKQLEDALAAKSVAEAKLDQLRNKVEGSPEKVKKASCDKAFSPPPPPPIPGSSGMPVPPPPPMPGCPMPPPMGLIPSAPGMPLSQDDLPLGLKPKKKWRNSGSLRKVNWKKIVPQNMTEKAFWLKVEEESLAKSHILNELDEKFSALPKKQTSELQNKGKEAGTMKKIKQVKVLDAKIAQNISILLGGSFKQMKYEGIKKSLLQCDDKVLNESIVEQLIQYLPPADQLNKLQQYKDSYNDLVEAEQFCLKLSEIERLLPRLKAMLFRLQYREMEKDSKPNIMSVTAACEEAKKSVKFSKILELILLLGNYMNSGSRNEQAFGFEMSFLPKLKSTKDVRNQSTLLHFLVETVEKDFPELLNFPEDMPHIDQASKVSMEDIRNTLKQIESNLAFLETEIKYNSVPQNEDDKFLEVMHVFCSEARIQFGVMMEMFKTLEILHEDLAEYFVYDKKAYSLNHFFTDLTTFKNSFLEARRENAKKRELEEKRERVRLAKEKADKEKKEKIMKSSSPEETQAETGMNCLLDVLKQTGEFSKQKRKKSRRQSVGEKRPQLPRSRSRTDLSLGTEIFS